MSSDETVHTYSVALATLIIIAVVAGASCKRVDCDPHGRDTCAAGFVCASDGACVRRCDIVKQDCPDPAKPKCQQYGDEFLVLACVANGTKEEGQPCTTNQDDHTDDCAKGLFCPAVVNGVPTDQLGCARTCGAATDCAAGSACFGDNQGGECHPTCTPFGTDCPANQNCVPSGYSTEGKIGTRLFACRLTGALPLGARCGNFGDCGPNAACLLGDGSVCAALCDAAHPCAAGTCALGYGGLPSTIGVCG